MHDEKETKVMDSLATIGVKVDFILQLGYFKAKSMFFRFNLNQISQDVKYIMHEYFPKQRFLKKTVSKNLRLSNKNRVLSLLSYKHYESSMRDDLKNKAQEIATIGINASFAFRQLLLYLENKRISIPPYSIFQDVISIAISNEEARIDDIISKHTTAKINHVFSLLLKKDDYLYEITALKKKPKDFTYKEIMTEVSKHKTSKELYQFAKKIIPKLGISKQNVDYYASMAEYYNVYKLRRMKLQKAQLYLLCFVYHRFQQINDNLIHCFIYWVDKYTQTGKQKAKEEIYQHKLEVNNHLPKVSQLLGLYIDESIVETETFGSVRKKAFQIIQKEKIPLIQQYLSGISFDKVELEWQGYELSTHKIRKNLRPIFSCLNLDGKIGNSTLKGIDLLSSKLLKNTDSKIPKCLVPKNIRSYLSTERNEINPDRFEFFIYQKIIEQLESGDLFCSDSTKFRSLANDLLSDSVWKNKSKIIKKLAIPKLRTPIKSLLKELGDIIDVRLLEVNERIKNGENEHIKIKTDRDGNVYKWSLPYQAKDEIVNNPFYNQLPQVGIIDVIKFAESHCRFMKSFTHIQPRYAKKRYDRKGILASIVANGTSLGIYKMAGISDLGFQALSNAEKCFLRPQTLKEANDIITNSIANLPIFKHWKINEDIIHASADGQKFETRLHTVKSRYSSKYFGLNQGVVAYTMVANHIPVNTKVIGANEYEGHYVFDTVFSNTSNVEIDKLSTDMHGHNQINFALLDFINCQYAPRYSRISQKKNLIYAFGKPKQYSDLFIKPAGRTKRELIIHEWDNMQRIVASLMLKETTQSVIVKKLCSYTRKNKTKEAFWEYDNIFRSLYILNFIDDISLRQNVQKALNRGEAYHQLRRAVAIANGGKFRGSNDREIQIWNDCSRLIANCIILYNSCIISFLLTQKSSNLSADFLSSLSPVAWQHINLFGWYDFAKEESFVDIQKMVDSIMLM